jgi:hypothetical protein
VYPGRMRVRAPPLGVVLAIACACGRTASDDVDTTSEGRDAATDAFAADVTEPEDVVTEDVVTDPPRACELGWGATASVTGTTPFGPFDGRYAWVGWLQGECGGPRIVIVERPLGERPDGWGFFDPDPPRLEFGAPYDRDAGSFVGSGTLDARFITATTEERISALVQTTRADEPDSPFGPFADYPRIEGNIAIESWGLSGSFVAPYCAPFDIYCP